MVEVRKTQRSDARGGAAHGPASCDRPRASLSAGPRSIRFGNLGDEKMRLGRRREDVRERRRSGRCAAERAKRCSAAARRDAAAGRCGCACVSDAPLHASPLRAILASTSIDRARCSVVIALSVTSSRPHGACRSRSRAASARRRRDALRPGTSRPSPRLKAWHGGAGPALPRSPMPMLA
jgi:hypothetical protein